MANISIAARSYSLILYIESSYCYETFVSRWRAQDLFNCPQPNRRLLRRLLLKFKSTGSINRISPSGRPRTQLVKEKIEMIAEHFAENPSDSLRNFSKIHATPVSTVRKILKEDIGWKAYRPAVVHKLSVNDPFKRLATGY